MPLCLPKNISKPLQKAIENGSADLQKLINAKTSEEREAMLADILGKNDAKSANASFEKNFMQQGGEELSAEDRKTVFGLTKKMEDAKRGLFDKNGELIEYDKLPKDDPKRIEYGSNKRALVNFLDAVKKEANSKATVGDLLKNKGNLIWKAAKFIGGNLKSIFYVDLSFVGNQGRKFMTSPSIWMDAFLKQVPDFVKGTVESPAVERFGKTMENNSVKDAVWSQIYASPEALSGKLDNPLIKDALGREETFPPNIISNVPAVGRLFRGAETSFSAAGLKTRFALLQKYIADGAKAGEDTNSQEFLDGAAKNVGNLTGRAPIKAQYQNLVGDVNVVTSSLRKWKADFDFIAAPFGVGKMDSFAKKQARINALKYYGSVALAMYAAEQAMPGSVEWNPTSTNFTAIKIGNAKNSPHIKLMDTGTAALITLAAREKTGEYISEKGNISKLDSGKYMSPTHEGIAFDYVEGKASPLVQDIFNTLAMNSGAKTDVYGNALPKNPTDWIAAIGPMTAKNFTDLNDNPDVQGNVMVLTALNMMGFFTSNNAQSNR